MNSPSIANSPMVGVLVNRRTLSTILMRQRAPAGLHHLVEMACKSRVACYIFSIEEIIWPESLVRGCHRDPESGSWTSSLFPLPDVVYDRATYPEEERPGAKEARSRLKSINGVKFINSKPYFAKWQTYRVLSSDKATVSCLPETILYDGPGSVVSMLEKYASVYVKSNYGSLGQEVIRIQKSAESGSYWCVFMKGERFVQKLAAGLDGINKVVREVNPKARFVVQQGIEVCTCDDRPFDIRVLLQKDGTGEWVVTAVVARVAQAGGAVTNVGAGGTVKYPEDLLVHWFGGRSGEIVRDIKHLAIQVGSCLDARYGPSGELGLDVGVDKSGGIWLFEVNSKPAKSTVRALGDRDIIDKAYRLPIEYARYLSGFGRPELL